MKTTTTTVVTKTSMVDCKFVFHSVFADVNVDFCYFTCKNKSVERGEARLDVSPRARAFIKAFGFFLLFVLKDF